MLFARIVLGLTAIMFGGHGAMCLLDPATIARESGIELPSPGAAAEARAMYGGLEFALGLYFGASAFRPVWVKHAVVVLVVVFAGLAVTRGVGLLLLESTDPYNLRAFAYEGTSLVLGCAALHALSRPGRSASAA